MVTWDPKTRPKNVVPKSSRGRSSQTPHSNQESTKPAMKACFFLGGVLFGWVFFPFGGAGDPSFFPMYLFSRVAGGPW